MEAWQKSAGAHQWYAVDQAEEDMAPSAHDLLKKNPQLWQQLILL